MKCLFITFLQVVFMVFFISAQECNQVVEQLSDLRDEQHFDSLIIVGEKYREHCCSKSDSLCIELLSPLIKAYYQNWEVDKNILAHQLVLEKYRDLGWENDSEYITFLSGLANLYTAANRYDESFRYARLSLEKAKENENKLGIITSGQSLMIANSILNIPNASEEIYIDVSKAVEGLPLGSMSIPMLQTMPFIVKYVYANYLIASGQDEATVDLCRNALKEMEPLLEIGNPFINMARIGFLSVQSQSYLSEELRDPDKASSYAESAIGLIEDDDYMRFPKSPKSDAFLKGKLFFQIGRACLYRRNLKEAKEAFLKSLHAYEYGAGRHSWMNPTGVKQSLAVTYALENKIDSSILYFSGLFDDLQDKTDMLMDVLPVQEKENLVFNNQSLANLYWSFVFHHYPLRPDLVTSGYDNELYIRRIVFDEWKKILSMARKENEGSVANLIVEWEETRRKISHLMNLESTALQSPLNINKLQENVRKLEQTLSDISPSFREGREQINFQEVKKTLERDEALVEFLEFPLSDASFTNVKEVFQAAVVITKEMSHPQFVPLFPRSKLDSLQQHYNRIYSTIPIQQVNGFYSDSMVYHLVWAEIEPFLKGIRKVFYSPSGLLHKMAFSAIEDEAGIKLSQKYELRQVFSGRDLVLLSGKEKFETEHYSILAVGDVNFDTLCYPEHQKHKENSVLKLIEKEVTLRDNGVDLKPLYWSGLELDKLKSLTDKADVSYGEYRGCEASEAVIKSIGNSIKVPSILHIATHGFFNSNSLTPKSGRFSFMDNPLFRSGLALAGAKGPLEHHWVPENIEDGVLTAYDIAHLDLSGIELVVLSACETGLGNVKNSEGVYGLQRAFKMAGARHLLISLWMVEDKAAQQFMNHFYERLFSGDSVQEAYQKTQKQMRKDYPDDPHKWAAFVLI